MAINNTIALGVKYAAMMDEVFKLASLTSMLENTSRVGDFVGANTVKYFKTSMDGLGAYSRNNGFVDGSVVGTWETMELAADRGRSFQVDSMDNEESLGLAFGTLAGEFVRTKVVPEVDAYRFAKVAGTSGIQTTSGATLNSTNILAAIDAAVNAMDEKEVPSEGRILFITPTLYQAMKESAAVTRFVQSGDTAIDRRFQTFDGMTIVKVPQTRFYTKIDLYDGSTEGQEAGGFIKNASTGKNINFMLLHPSALLTIKKHAPVRIFRPEVNQKADAWKLDYRLYHDQFVYENKVDGIYLHKVA